MTQKTHRLVYEAAGQGETVVLVHAGIADRRMWDAQVPAFSERFRTITYDMRGFGESEMVDEPFTHAGDLVELMDSLEVDRAHIIGCSIGASTTLQFAIDYPTRASSLVLVNGDAPGFVPEGGYYDPPQWEKAEAAIEAGDFERAAELEVEMWVVGMFRSPSDVPAEIRDAVYAMDLAALGTESRRAEFGQRPDPPAGTRLTEVQCPALIVVGELDLPDMRPIGEYLADGIAGGSLVTISGAAHLPNMERATEFNRVVLDFLDGLPA